MDREKTFARASTEHEAFVRELGQLTLAWSDLETVIYKLLKHYAGVSDEVARAVFSGTRARTAVGFLRAIAHNTSMESTRQSDLEEIFTQTLAINSMRDFVVHHVDGSQLEFEDDDPERRFITDGLRVSRKGKAKTYLVGSATLVAMREDCIECCWRLQAHWDPQNEPFLPGPGTNGRRSPWKFVSPLPDLRWQRSW